MDPAAVWICRMGLLGLGLLVVTVLVAVFAP